MEFTISLTSKEAAEARQDVLEAIPEKYVALYKAAVAGTLDEVLVPQLSDPTVLQS